MRHNKQLDMDKWMSGFKQWLRKINYEPLTQAQELKIKYRVYTDFTTPN
jgi:hypothetical protein